MKRILFLSTVLTVFILTSACSKNSSSESDSEPTTTEPAATAESPLNLSVSNSCVLIQNTSGVAFSVQLSEGMAENNAEVGLYDENGNKIADMLDDGNDCDLKAGDLIYSASFMSQTKSVYKFTAKVGDITSNVVNVSFIDEITDDDFAEMDKLTAEIDAATDSLKNSKGEVPYKKRSEAYDLVMKVLEKFYDDGKVVEYHRNSDNIAIKFAMGVTYIYEVRDPNCD